MKKETFFIILCLLPTCMAFGQDTTYFDYAWKKVSSSKLASYYKIVLHDQADTNRVLETIYFKSGQIRTHRNYSNYKDKILDGNLKEWYKNGQLRKDIDYTDGKKNGKLLTYWENGKPKRIDVYEHDKLVEGKCLNPDGLETFYYDYETKAEFIGGDNKLIQYLRNKANYPKKAKKEGIEGTVIVAFVINSNGSTSNVEIVQGVNDELDKEAMRVIKNMPKWKPGMQDGIPVRTGYQLPINFLLD